MIPVGPPTEGPPRYHRNYCKSIDGSRKSTHTFHTYTSVEASMPPSHDPRRLIMSQSRRPRRPTCSPLLPPPPGAAAAPAAAAANTLPPLLPPLLPPQLPPLLHPAGLPQPLLRPASLSLLLSSTSPCTCRKSPQRCADTAEHSGDLRPHMCGWGGRETVSEV